MTAEAPLDRWTLTAYALPGFILAVPKIPIYLYLLALYGDRFGLGLALTGTVLLFARLFDVVTDPLIGRISDRLRWRAGRRKPLIVLGGAVAVPPQMLGGGEHFALEVQGDSMIEAGIHDGDTVLVPKGYHPCAACHGYDLYYLNVMAGPKRQWRFHNDPDHEWLFEAG